MQNIQQHHLESYIGIQYLCCTKWRGKFRLDTCEDKWNAFMCQYNKIERRIIREIILTIQKHLKTADLWELAVEYSSSIPGEHVEKTIDRCRNIIDASPYPIHDQEKKLLSLIEYHSKTKKFTAN